jgi:hypothetical protein
MVAQFRKPGAVTGHKLALRDAGVADAAFILALRTDARKAQHLSQTPHDLQRQQDWLQQYAQDASQVYFIITNRTGHPVGTVRLYDQRGDSFCWGSWIKADDAPSGFGVESALMVYEVALAMGFDAAHFDVRRENTSVCQFHTRFGARLVSEDALNFYYEMDRAAIDGALAQYRKYLPAGVSIDW